MILEKKKTVNKQNHAAAPYRVGLQGAILVPQPEKNKINMGYGACSSPGCYCKAYEGSAATCSNCGHSYEQHW